MKRKDYTDWEKIFANNVMNKSLIFKWLTQLSIIKKKPNQKKKKWAEDLNRHFFQRRHKDGQEANEKILNIANY